MKPITKEELENLILHGIASDIFIAERAYSMFKTIGDKSDDISGRNGYQDFFLSAQIAFKDQFLLAASRIFDTPSRNKTRCVLGVLTYLSNNSNRLPKIVENLNLISAMQMVGFSSDIIGLVSQPDRDKEITVAIVQHFNSLIGSPENRKLLIRLKGLRDKRLAHNELVGIGENLAESIDIVTYRDLLTLIEIAKGLVGVIGWAYMSMVFVHNGRYLLTDDAQRPNKVLKRLMDKIATPK